MLLGLAVVPILTNAGIAVLPAILAGIGSMAALLLKPREAMALFRRKPHVPIILLLIVSAIGGGFWWMLHTPASAPTELVAHVRTDWAKVALELIRQEQMTRAGNSVATASMPAAVVGHAPFNRRASFARTGYAGGASPRRLQGLWEYNANKGYYYLSDAAVYGERIYAAGCLQDVTGIFGTLTCLDARGDKLWEIDKIGREPLKGFFSSPSLTADGKYLVIGQGLHADKDCALLCFDTATGRLLWRLSTPLNHIESTAAILGDVAVVGAGAIEKEDGTPPATGTGTVLAVRISTGEKLWEQDVVDPESCPAMADDGTVYIGSGVGGKAIVALRGGTDAELKSAGQSRILWSRQVDHPALGAVTLAGDKLLIGIGEGDFVKAAHAPVGAVLCLDRKTGDILWQTPMGDAVLGAVAIVDDLAIAPVRSGSVVAMQLSDGHVLWRQNVSERAPVLASPVVTDKYIYAVASDGTLSILERNTGKILESHQVNHPSAPGVDGFSMSSPIVANGRLYVGSETGGLRCFIGGRETP